MKKTISILIFCFALITIQNKSLANEEIPTAPNLDLQKYLGKWYEVASIPQWFQKDCIANTTAEYSAVEDSPQIQVLNSCDTSSGDRKTAKGRAKVTDPTTSSKLKVTFVKIIGWIFAFGGNYWVLDIDPEYSYALIGDPSRKYAWVLSRTPSLPKETLDKIADKYKSLGYDTCLLLTSIQSGGFSERTPLCQLHH